MRCSAYFLVAAMVHSERLIALATNIAFMPGDACFPSVLTEDVADEFAKSDSEIELYYSSTWSGGYFCGTSGYVKLKIQEIPESWTENIKEVYDELLARRQVAAVQDDTNVADAEHEGRPDAIFMFVYNRSFDLDKFRLGLRYNEKWFDPLPDVKEEFRDLVGKEYRPYLHSIEAAGEDWRNSSNVEGLKLRYPDLGDQPAEIGRKFGVEEPVIATAKNVRLIILPNRELEPYFRKGRETVTECDVVEFNSDGIWKYALEDRKKIQSVRWNRKAETEQK